MSSAPVAGPNRRAFTLIELLVVLTIMMVLAGIIIGIMGRVQDRRKVGRNADQVRAFYAEAKLRAKRDRVTTGVRLISDASGNGRTLHYIQQPDDFSGGQITGVAANVASFTAVDFTGGFGNAANWQVQPGDYLEVNRGGLVHSIVAVMNGNQLQLATSPSVPFPTGSYRIIRQPRILMGDEPLTLNDDAAVSLAFSKNLPPTGDVLFSPAGNVLSPAAMTDPTVQNIVIWVYNMQVGPTAGEPNLVTIYPRSGFVATHPIDLHGATYYTFTQDGKSSGM
jgi:prepilin-type N-terminal cleavage/methylation domain-containing protein